MTPRPDYPEAELLEYLKWYRVHADFGPAHEDVERWLNDRFEEETKTRIPEGWY